MSGISEGPRRGAHSESELAGRNISKAAARRVALAAQGFGKARAAEAPGADQIRNLVSRLGLLQLDTVSVFCRSHYMPVYSRLGPYDRALLDRMAGHSTAGLDGIDDAGRHLVEYSAHEASLVAMELYPLFRWRMARVDEEAWGPLVKLARDKPEVIAAALMQVADHGPIRASATGGTRTRQSTGALWNFQEGKAALEYLLYAGDVAAAGRVNFERLYDLPERVIAPGILRQPPLPGPDAQRQLVRIAAQALGIATEPDLGDYFRLPRKASKDRVAELVESGELIPITVDGWGAAAYLWPAASRPRRIEARTLLSPFDSLIWYRDRTERLFGFQYRIEIYTPAPKRVYGYYVLPFLLDEALVARVDLKSDRKAGVLLVQGAYAEDGVDRTYVATELAAELRQVATWLGLGEVVIQPRGDLSDELQTVSR
jgi:uncharacterized protein